MIAVLLIIHLLVATALVGVILMQHSEGGALGMSGGPSGMMTGRSAANLLTRLTMILGAVFIGNSILLAVVSGVDATNRSVVDRLETGDDSELPFSFEDGETQDTIPVLDDTVTLPDTQAGDDEPAAPETGEDDTPQIPD